MFGKFSFSINQDLLKIFALIAMTVDHYAQIISPPHALEYRTYIGRFAFPVFSFLMMYHLAEKHIFKKYIVRLSVFGVLSAIVIFYCGIFNHLNVLFTFLFPIMTVAVIRKENGENAPKILKYLFFSLIVLILSAFSVLSSYGIYGYFYLLSLYLFLLKRTPVFYLSTLILSFFTNISFYTEAQTLIPSVVGLLATFLTLHLDMERKYPRIIRHWSLFYIYYPAHLFVLYALKQFIR